MNIVFNKCIFAYLCLFYSSTKYLYEFQNVFVNFRFIDIFVKIATDFFDIFVKYRYIRKIIFHKNKKNSIIAQQRK